ncbi:MAG: tetratricopeptide repeat protein [Candidatus Solibacter sp.]|jgi:tetratricopeptide (TPR) repeat protein
MRTCSLLLVLFLSLMAASLSAQRQKVTINPSTPEGQLLQRVTEESDDAKKVALMEQFLAQYPKHEGAVWVYSQMVASCAKLGQFDKVMAAAEKLLALDAADLETAAAAVRAAGEKKDPDAVRKWAVQCSDLARKVAQAPKTEDEDNDAFKQRVDYAKRMDAFTEYALFASVGQVPEAAKKGELLKTLEERDPESTYLSQGYGLYFLALVQSGDTPAAVAVAEKRIAQGQGNELMLATAGDFYLRQNREPQKVLDYSSKLLELVNTKPKPEGVSDADWQKSKDYFLASGQWMTGVVYCSQGKFGEADKVLRAALPLLEGNDADKAGALFNLGVANSRLKKLADAIKFFEQCVAIKSPYQATCTDHLKAIRSTYRVVK